MKVELLGTGGYFANARRQTACVLLPEEGIVFDAGSGIFRLPQRTVPPHLNLFLTHPHLDHIAGLPTLLIPILNQQFASVTVHGNQYTLDAVAVHLFAEAIFPVPIPFTCREIPSQGDRELRPGLTICWQSLPSHPGGSMAYRIDLSDPDRKCSLAYITDTCPDGSYLDFIAGVDLLLHECYFDDARANLAVRTGHSCASDVARVAAAADVGQLVVMHVDPTLDLDDPLGLPGMRAIFPQTDIGFDGMQIEVVGRDQS